MQAIRMGHRLGFGLLAVLLASTPALAQTSNGTDGALNIQASNPNVVNGVYTWDPVRDNLDTNGDNVYHFTTVTIGPGVYVRMLSNKMRRQGPVVFLASGAVTIDGSLDLSGENGAEGSAVLSLRSPSLGGPGGFPGGSGAKPGGVGEPGSGPGGAVASTNNISGCSAAHATVPTVRFSGLNYTTLCPPPSSSVYGNPLLQPLVGGSGGAGGSPGSNTAGGSGGGGGGAIRIRSAVSITFGEYGYIAARGGAGGGTSGNSGCGGSGSGGAIHIQAPLVDLGRVGGIDTRTIGSLICEDGGGEGRNRIDTNDCRACQTSYPSALIGPFVETPLPVNVADLKILSVNGTAAPSAPLNRYTAPDMTLPAGATAVPVVIQTANIPNGTTLNLLVSTDPGAADQVLNGTVNNNQVTVNVNFQNNAVSRLWVKAAW